jgi:hypothetical protein
MTDAFVHLIQTYEFTIGWIVGGCVFFFAGLAIGWAKGNRNGWYDGWHDARGE